MYGNNVTKQLSLTDSCFYNIIFWIVIMLPSNCYWSIHAREKPHVSTMLCMLIMLLSICHWPIHAVIDWFMLGRKPHVAAKLCTVIMLPSNCHWLIHAREKTSCCCKIMYGDNVTKQLIHSREKPHVSTRLCMMILLLSNYHWLNPAREKSHVSGDNVSKQLPLADHVREKP